MPAAEVQGLTEALDAFFHKDSIFCFTSDVEWAPESAISETLGIFNQIDIPISFFLTHDSEIIRKEFGNQRKSSFIGVHPNFLPNSTQGSTVPQQIETVRSLWPKARYFRSHAFFDNTYINRELVSKGFEFDSNEFHFLSPYIVPVLHHTGLMRFPVFWEDDAHWLTYPNEAASLEKYLEKPGLKIFNFHPLSVALNIPSTEYYQRHKFLCDAKNRRMAIGKYTYHGRGTKTLLQEILSLLSRRKSTVMPLHEIYQDVLAGRLS